MQEPHQIPQSIEHTLVHIVEWEGYPNIRDIYIDGISINPSMGRIKKGIYLERRLTTTGMSKMPKFEVRF